MAVAVIMAVLAAVAVPIYSGYVSSQRHKAAKVVAQTAAVTANSLFRKNGAGHPTTEELNASLFHAVTGDFTIYISTSGDSVVAENTGESVRVAAKFR